MTEFHLNTRIGTVAFATDDYTCAKLGVSYVLPHAPLRCPCIPNTRRAILHAKSGLLDCYV